MPNLIRSDRFAPVPKSTTSQPRLRPLLATARTPPLPRTLPPSPHRRHARPARWLRVASGPHAACSPARRPAVAQSWTQGSPVVDERGMHPQTTPRRISASQIVLSTVKMRPLRPRVMFVASPSVRRSGRSQASLETTDTASEEATKRNPTTPAATRSRISQVSKRKCFEHPSGIFNISSLPPLKHNVPATLVPRF